MMTGSPNLSSMSSSLAFNRRANFTCLPTAGTGTVDCEAAFQNFLDEGERQDIHKLRDSWTTDYIWTLYEPWDLREWMSGGNDSSASRDQAVTPPQ